MRILVTGGAGFLGSHLCDRLIREGHDVACMDNFYTGRERNIGHLLGHARFKLFPLDVVEPFDVEVDQIYNFACPASPVHYQADAVKTLKTSVWGAMHCLELAQRRKIRVLHASTSEVYGDPTEHPQKEEYRGNVNPIGIRACYDEGKRAAEALCFDFHRQYKTDIRIIRIFNTYGPKMSVNDGRVVSNFIVQALKGESLTIYGDGKQTRSFCYVDDLIDGIVRMMNNPSFVGPVNLGNPNEFTMLELAQKVLEYTKSTSKLIFKALPADDPKQRCPDISLAKKHLDWEPKVVLDQGLLKTIEFFQQQLHTASSKAHP